MGYHICHPPDGCQFTVTVQFLIFFSDFFFQLYFFSDVLFRGQIVGNIIIFIYELAKLMLFPNTAHLIFSYYEKAQSRSLHW